MCSINESIKCSICNEYFDPKIVRMIIENCGHQKCRQCFIKESNGCTICIRDESSLYANQTECDIPSTTTSHCTSKFYENVNDKDFTQPDRENGKVLVNGRLQNVEHIKVNRDGRKAISYQCLICNKSFKSRNSQKYHLYCDKNQEKPIACDRCDQRFITVAHFNYHRKNQHSSSRHHCNVCNKVYSSNTGLRKHMQKHENEYKHACNVCSQRFIYKEQLNMHKNRHNNIYYKCSQCPKEFLYKSSLSKHTQSHLGKTQEVCSVCKKMYNNKHTLRTHMLTHLPSKPFECQHCNKHFIDKRSLDRHKSIHCESIFYECTLCSARSARKDNIRRHVRNQHSELMHDFHTIMTAIVANFEKKNRFPSKANNEEKPIRSNTTSVIRFAKSNALVESTVPVISLEANPSTDSSRHIEQNESISADVGSDTNAIDDLRNDHESNSNEIYEPLTLDPIPPMNQPPVLCANNHSSRFDVYRELLSPYLK